MARQLQNPDWKARAGAARAKLRVARHGSKDAALSELARGNDANTVRREIFALDFLDELLRTSPSLREDLEHVPFSIIELLARWRAFDKKAALKAARDAAKGRYTVARLAEAMAAARREGGDNVEPGSYHERVAGPALEAIRELLGGDISPDEGASVNPTDPSVDFRYLRMIGSPPRFESVAALIVGPYKDPGLYKKRRRDWLYRALGMSWFYNHVVVILPHVAELEGYRSWIRDAQKRVQESESGIEIPGKLSSRRAPSVHVVCPDLWRHPTLTDEEAAALSQLR